ncbi:MAG: Ig-like domain-containing protein, partial [Acidimicrobiia bacterium]
RRVWDGSIWSGESSLLKPSGASGVVRWTTLAANPLNDQIVAGLLTYDGDIWMVAWTGSGWVQQGVATTTASGTTEPAMALAWEGTSGQVLMTYGESAQSALRYRTFSFGTGWSGENVGPNLGDTPNSHMLYPEPETDGIMLGVNDDSSDLHYLYWNGGGWGADNELETSTGDTKNQPFLFLWQGVTGSPPNVPPVAVGGGGYIMAEGEDLVLDGSGSSDPDGDTLTYSWDLDNDGFYDDASGMNTTVAWATLVGLGFDDDDPSSLPIGLHVDDGRGGVDTDEVKWMIRNAPPTILASGTGSAAAGVPYGINLSYSDPGDDAPTQWTIDWGDGTSNVYPGATTVASHTYATAGLTHGITATVIDDDGTWTNADLVVPSLNAGSTHIGRYDSPSGSSIVDLGPGSPVDRAHGVAVGPDGLLYVSSYWNGLILRFDPETNLYVDTFVAGGDPLVGPSGLVFDDSGILYVSDYDMNRVRHYDTSGTNLGTFAVGGGLSGPADLVFGPDGHLYVSGFTSNDVNKYNGSTGAHMATVVTPGFGGLTIADSLAFGPDGHLYVSSMGTDQVKEYDISLGTYLGNFASGDGLDGPAGVDFGPDGKLYVSSELTDSVKVFDGTSGTYLGDFVAPNLGGLERPAYGAFVPDHWVTVTPPPNTDPIANDDAAGAPEDGVVVINVKVNDTDAEDGIPAGPAAVVTQPLHGVAVANSGGMGTVTYTPDPDYFGPDSFTYTIDDSVGATSNVATVTITVTGSDDPPTGNDDGPYSVLEDGTLTVGAQGQQFSLTWGSNGSGDGEFLAQRGIAVAADGSVYVVDTGHDRVQKFDADGNYLLQWGSSGTGNSQFDTPMGVAIASDGTVYISDVFNDRIQFFDPSGTYLGQFGSTGTGNGQMDSPRGIDFGPDGNLYVADTYNHRVQVFEPDGTYMRQWG